MFKATPMILGVSSVSALVVAVFLRYAFDQQVLWQQFVVGAAAGIVLCAALSIAIGVWADCSSGVSFGVVFCIEAGIVLGSLFGAQGEVSQGLAIGVATGISFGLVFGINREAFEGLVLGTLVGGLVTLFVWTSSGFPAALKFGSCFAGSFVFGYVRLVDYPLHAAEALKIKVESEALGADCAKLWANHPLAWNEAIWIPLPSSGRFLANLVKLDRKLGFKSIVFVAVYRPFHLRAVENALGEVILDDLELHTFTEFDPLVEKLEWLRDPPGRLPTAIQTFAPQFVSLAERAVQHLNLISRHQQVEVLTRALGELANLRKSLIGTKDSYAPRLLGRATEWEALFQAELRTTQEAAKAEGSIPEMFRAGSYLKAEDARHFFGRETDTRTLEAFVMTPSAPSSILLQGARRMGKSSLVLQLPRMLGPDCAACCLDMTDAANNENLPRFFTAVSEEMSNALQRRGVKVERLTLAQLQVEPFAIFGDWLKRVESALRPGLRVLLCFDEYERLDRLVRLDADVRLLDYLRFLQQNHRSLILLYCGMKPFHTLGREWASRFVSARTLKLSFLDEAASTQLLTKPVPEFPDDLYAPEALAHRLAMTRCQPFLMQATAEILVHTLNQDKRRHAELTDVDAAIDKAFDHWRDYFHDLWNDAEPDGQRVLCDVLAGNPVSAGPALKRLCDYDVLTPEGKFQVPMLERWMRKALSTGEIVGPK